MTCPASPPASVLRASERAIKDLRKDPPNLREGQILVRNLLRRRHGIWHPPLSLPNLDLSVSFCLCRPRTGSMPVSLFSALVLA